jgi:uncharacterized protein YjiS (DUF1127 family)
MTSTQLTPAIARIPASPTARMACFARRTWHSYLNWRARRATVLILRTLDRRTLRDIGIDPSEIESYVYGRRGERRRGYDEDWR